MVNNRLVPCSSRDPGAREVQPRASSTRSLRNADLHLLDGSYDHGSPGAAHDASCHSRGKSIFWGVKDFNHFESTGLQHFLMTMETAKGSVGESDLAAYEKVQAACFFRPSALRCSLKCFQFTAEFGMEG